MSRLDGSFKGGKINAINSRRKALEKYYENPNICINCGEIIKVKDNENAASTRKKIFCSHSCAAQYNNRGVVRNPPKIKYCKHCGNSFYGNHVHCDDCINKRSWIKQQSLEECKDDRAVRRILLKERDHTCERCGLSEQMGEPISLELHHEDGNSDNIDRRNLKFLCPNCHSLTSNQKGKNKGKGKRQLNRKQRFREGKTF